MKGEGTGSCPDLEDLLFFGPPRTGSDMIWTDPEPTPAFSGFQEYEKITFFIIFALRTFKLKKHEKVGIGNKQN